MKRLHLQTDATCILFGVEPSAVARKEYGTVLTCCSDIGSNICAGIKQVVILCAYIMRIYKKAYQVDGNNMWLELQ